jgi:hypothetical protein
MDVVSPIPSGVEGGLTLVHRWNGRPQSGLGGDRSEEIALYDLGPAEPGLVEVVG